MFHLQVGRLEHLQPNKVGYKLTRPVESLWLQGEAVVPSQRRTGRCLKAAAFGPGKSQTHRPPPVPKQNSANFIRGKNKRQLVWVPNQPPNLSNKQKNVGRILQNLSPPWREAPQRGHLRKRIPTTVTNSPVGTCRIALSYLSACHKLHVTNFVTNSLVGTCRLVLGLRCLIYRHVTNSSCIILSKLYEETFENAQ